MAVCSPSLLHEVEVEVPSHFKTLTCQEAGRNKGASTQDIKGNSP